MSVGVFFLLPLPALLLPSCRKRRPRETAVPALVENVRTQRRKQTGRQLSVFLCEVIMCSPRCFCSHANEVDRIGNHFQTLSQGKSRNGKTKAGTKGCFAVVCACTSVLWVCTEVEVEIEVDVCLKWACVRSTLYLYTVNRLGRGRSKGAGFSWWGFHVKCSIREEHNLYLSDVVEVIINGVIFAQTIHPCLISCFPACILQCCRGCALENPFPLIPYVLVASGSISVAIASLSETKSPLSFLLRVFILQRVVGSCCRDRLTLPCLLWRNKLKKSSQSRGVAHHLLLWTENSL